MATTGSTTTPHDPSAGSGASQAAPLRDRVEVTIANLAQLAQQESNATNYYRRGFKVLCQLLGAMHAEMDLRIGANTLNETYSSESCPAVVLSLVQAMVLESGTERTSEFRVYPTGPKTSPACLLTAPLIDPVSGGCLGAIAIASPGDDEFQAAQDLAKLQTLAGMFTAFAVSVGKAKETGGGEQIKRALERASKHENIVELAFSLVNSLAKKYECIQAAFGIARDSSIDIVAVSGMDRWSKRAGGIVALEQALGETLDFGAIIEHPSNTESDDKPPTMLHERWRQIAGGAVVSIPIKCGDNVVAVAGFVVNQDAPWSATDVQRVDRVLGSFGPIVAVLGRQHRTTRQRLALWGSQLIAKAKGTPRSLRFAAVVLCCALAWWLVFGTMNYRMRVKCEIAPTTSHQLTTTFGGTIDDAFVSAGDHVKEGQELVLLDAEPTQLELNGILAEIAATRSSVDEALVQRDSHALAAARSELTSLMAQRDSLERRLDSTLLRAPCDGIVLRGDVQSRIGETVPEGESLLEISHTSDRLILLRVPEADALDLKKGLGGSFVLEAKPFERTTCRVVRVLPATEVHDGVNYIVAEAEIDAYPEWFKVGMEGTATINAGPRNVSWILFHDAWDWLRGSLWL